MFPAEKSLVGGENVKVGRAGTECPVVKEANIELARG